MQPPTKLNLPAQRRNQLTVLVYLHLEVQMFQQVISCVDYFLKYIGK